MIQYTLYNSETGEILSSGEVANREWLLVPTGASVLWEKYEGKSFTLPGGVPTPKVTQKTLAEIKRSAKAEVASRRWEVEVGGIPFGGGTLPSDDRSKVLLASAAEQARRNPDFVVDWKLSDGSWAPLNAATIIAASESVLAWVSDCFAREKVLCDQIDAAADQAAVEALKPVINAFWAQ